MADHGSRGATRMAHRSRRGDDPKMIGNWKIGRTIGKGSSGRVKIARHVKTGQYAAIKIVSKHALITSRMSMSDAADTADKILLGIEREIVIMKLIDHPNILKLYDVWETSGELYLVMEYVEGGELFDYLVSRGRLPVDEALHYFQQIIFAVDYCHRFNIAHRDLKPENLLLDKSRNIKVADFGMAAWEGGVGMLETSCGSPHYASPEVVEGRSYHGSTSDIWSCGVILFALLAGRLPFDDENIRHLLEKVKLGKYAMPGDIDPMAKDLITRMLQKDVAKRITMPEIMKHPFFVSKPPRPVEGALPPPSLEEVDRPVNSVEDIDADIFGNLQTLWHGAPDEEIIEGLTNSDKTWEKAVYHLLLRYRARQMENFNMDDEDEDSSGRSKKREVPKPRDHARPARQAPQEETPSASTASTMEPVSAPLERPKRPDPPTPRKAMGVAPPATRPASPTKSPVQAVVQQPIVPRPASPTRPAMPAGPRPASPVKSSAPVPAPAVAEMSPVPTPSSPATTTSYLSNGTPVLDMPELQDESVQRFFRQIVEHLGAMQIRQSLIVPTVVAPAAGGEQPKIVLAPASTAAPPPTPASAVFDDRFADADDDDTASTTTTTSVRTVTPNPGARGHGHGYGHDAGLGYGNAYASPNPMLPLPPRGMGAHLQASREAPPRPPIALRNNPSYARGEADKENGAGGRPGVGGPRPMSMSAPNRASAMMGANRANNVASPVLERRKTDGGKHVHIVEPPKVLKKKKSMVAVDASPALSDGSFVVPGETTPKRSWFNNLFKFKPASYQLLSVFDGAVTRQECARLLVGMGVHVSDSGSILRCRMDEIRDPTGTTAVAKAVRFRVEMHAVGASTAHAVAGYMTGMTMVQEKGALSSFKLVYNRLRREWDLDGMPRTPASALDTAESFQII